MINTNDQNRTISANDYPITSHAIAHTSNGRVIVGTRLTVYDVMDYLAAQYPPHLIQEKLGLTEPQLTATLNHIATYHADVTAEYHQILQTAQERYEYWQEKLRSHQTIAPATPNRERSEHWAKLRDW